MAGTLTAAEAKNHVGENATVCGVVPWSRASVHSSDEAKFITGVVLPVDGGQSARIG